MIQVSMHSYLILQDLFLVWVKSIFRNYFQSSLCASWFVNTESHLSIGTCAYNLSNSVVTSNLVFILVFKNKVIWLNEYILNTSDVLFTALNIRIDTFIIDGLLLLRLDILKVQIIINSHFIVLLKMHLLLIFYEIILDIRGVFVLIKLIYDINEVKSR